MKKTVWMFLVCCFFICGFTACGKKEIWDVTAYEKEEDILCVEEMELEQVYEEGVEVNTYKIRYQSEECEVVAYLSVPIACLDEKKPYPCIIYNRGGNREYGANISENIAYLAKTSEMIVFASQYRGVDGGTGKDEFGGSDLQDVLKLIDLCEQFSFVDMERLYMMGTSRGGMMTYLAAKEDDRIKKAVVVSGEADLFMGWEEREDMREVFSELIGKTPEEAPEEYEKRSATYWADEILCPVLIIHSKLDEKVSYAQAEKMIQCLQNAGKEYQFITHEDNVHGLHPEDFDTIMEWFEK